MLVSLKEATILQRVRQEGQSLFPSKALRAAGELWEEGWGEMMGWRGGSMLVALHGIKPLSADESIVTAQESWNAFEKR